jgi:hypothetical protein
VGSALRRSGTLLSGCAGGAVPSGIGAPVTNGPPAGVLGTGGGVPPVPASSSCHPVGPGRTPWTFVTAVWTVEMTGIRRGPRGDSLRVLAPPSVAPPTIATAPETMEFGELSPRICGVAPVGAVESAPPAAAAASPVHSCANAQLTAIPTARTKPSSSARKVHVEARRGDRRPSFNGTGAPHLRRAVPSSVR